MTGLTDHKSRALAMVSMCNDPTSLRRIAENASRLGEIEVQKAAQLKLYSVLPEEAPGTLEHDVWQSIHALEDALSAERGKTIRLSRTRQKIARDGELKTVADLIKGKPSGGFEMLVEREMNALTFEAVALRHPTRFLPAILEIADARLSALNSR